MIFIREETIDPAEMSIYGGMASATLASHPVTLLSRYHPMTVLEGPDAEAVLIVSFPDAAAARKWYDSPEYQGALQHRLKGATYRVILTEVPDAD